MSEPLRRIAITGATGYIGGRLAPRLIADGYRVRCLVRSPNKIAGRDWADHPGVEVRKTDLANAVGVAANLEGCDAAFYLVHSMTSAGAQYAHQDRTLALRFAEAARQASVGRIIYLGGLGETGTGLSEHLSSRRDVEEALASTGVPVTVLRAAMIIGSGSASFEILRYLVERLPIMITPKWVSTPCQPIAVRNVIGYLAGALAAPETTGAVFDIGGSEVMCYLCGAGWAFLNGPAWRKVNCFSCSARPFRYLPNLFTVSASSACSAASALASCAFQALSHREMTARMAASSSGFLSRRRRRRAARHKAQQPIVGCTAEP